ncbi:MAG: ATP-binding protein [Myxococcota bacterium]
MPTTTTATPEERALLDDVAGCGSFELAWLEGALNGWPAAPVPGCLTVWYARYDTGIGEAHAHAIAPVHARAIPAPLHASVGAVVSEVLVRHDRAPDLLERVLTEVIANGVGHRSYAPQWVEVPVIVEDYTDRVRVRSPGMPPERVLRNDGSIVGRWSRNPRLMAGLGAFGLVHQQGRGLVMAPRLARDAGYRLALLAADGEVVVDVIAHPESWEHSPDRVRQRQPEDVRAERILDHLARASEASISSIASALMMPAPTVRASMRRLVAAGRAEPTCEASRSPRQTYRLTPEEAERRA